MGRQKTLRIQCQQYAKRWSEAKKCVDREFKLRLKELEDLRISSHKHLDDTKQSCDLRLQALKSQLRRDIEMVKSLQALKMVERDAQKMLEVAKRVFSPPPKLDLLPNLNFSSPKIKIALSAVKFGSLSECIGEVRHRCFSSDIAELVASYEHPSPEFKGECYVEYKDGDRDVCCVAGLSDNRVATSYACSDYDYYYGSIHIWNSWSGGHSYEIRVHSSDVTSMVGVEGNQLWGGSNNGNLRMWDLESGRCICVFKGHAERVNDVCAFVDSKGALRGASGSADKTIRIWDLNTGECLRVIREHTDMILSVSVPIDGGGVIVSGSSDNTMRVWNTKTGKCLKVIGGYDGGIGFGLVVVLSDQKRVVSVGSGNTLCVWDIETGKCLRILKGHTGEINCVSAFADGQRIISGSADKTIRVWNVDVGKCLHTVNTNSAVLYMCRLYDDYVVSISADNKTQVWV